jgi:hypothetical protein
MTHLFALALCLASPPPPAFEPTSSYAVQQVEGWKVYVHKRLLEEEKELGRQTLELLRTKLYDVTRMVPKGALAKLRQVPIWVEINPKVACACYHPSRGWLQGHGFNPDKAKSVEIGGPRNFLSWTRHQPNMVLHELAHAYHHQVLGYGHPGIKAAFKRAVDSKSYESVLLFNGRKVRHYALTSDQEYFAETSEAYFGTNDFYPFVRAELEAHDPEMFKLLGKLWGK